MLKIFKKIKKYPIVLTSSDIGHERRYNAPKIVEGDGVQRHRGAKSAITPLFTLN